MKKKDVNWQDISTPELVAKQSEAYGYNQAIDEILTEIEENIIDVDKPTGVARKFAFADEWYAGYNASNSDIRSILKNIKNKI